MYKSIFSRGQKWLRTGTAVIAAAMIFVFAGCQQPTTEVEYRTKTVTNTVTNTVNNVYVIEPVSVYASALSGTWKDTYNSSITIPSATSDTDEFINKYVDYYTNATAIGYKGSNVYYRKISDTSGYLYMKYTRSMLPDYTYSESASDVGKWYAVYIKDLTATTLKYSGAYLSGGVTSTDTLSAAVTTFTVDNGYFAAFSEATKQ